MSGYGRGVADGEGLRVSFELRSVNHRFCRVGMHLSAELGFFEPEANKLVSGRVARGKVDVTGSLRGPRSTMALQVNEEVAAGYVESLEALAAGLGIEPRVDLALLMGMPGVLSSQSAPQLDPERDTALVRGALDEALDAFDKMRLTEGEHLAADMRQRFEIVEAMVDNIEGMTVDLPRHYRDILTARIETLVEDSTGELDPARLAQEVAYHADRSDITEELVRLRSHISKARGFLDKGGAVGRSLEFLLQETHREINTIGAKAKVVEIGDLVVDLKSELERIREQVQNVE